MKEIEVSEAKVTLVDFSGTYKERQAGEETAQRRPIYRILGAVVVKPNGRWYLKGYGPEKTMARHAEAFKAFVEAFAGAE